MSLFSFPYTIFLLFFGTQTIWYFHSQTVCANVLFIKLLLSNTVHRINTVPYISKELFNKYYSIAFAILPGIAGGLALELSA